MRGKLLFMKPLSAAEIDELYELATFHHQTYSREDFLHAAVNGSERAPLHVTVDVKRIEVMTPTIYFSMERFE